VIRYWKIPLPAASEVADIRKAVSALPVVHYWRMPRALNAVDKIKGTRAQLSFRTARELYLSGWLIV